MAPYLRPLACLIGLLLSQTAFTTELSFATGSSGHTGRTSFEKLEPSEIQLTSFTIPHFSESANRGSFFQLYRTIEQAIGYPIQVSLMPTKRAQLNFQLAQADVYFPGLQTSIPSQHIRSETVFYKELFAFVRKGREVPESFAELTNLKIGLTAGYNYGEIIQYSNFNIQKAQSDDVNLLKLEAGRIDVFIVERYSGLKALAESKADNILYDLGKPLSREPVSFIFQDTERGHRLKKMFDAEIIRLKAAGNLNSILLNH